MSNKYGDEYFKTRFNNDSERVRSFKMEAAYMDQYFPRTGKICDIGCSTGEFLKSYNWQGEMYGMEVNDMAIEASQKIGISFDKNILNVEDFFDVIVFRGTIQHVPDPFGYIEKSYRALKKGGHLVFLATPNANSIVYKLYNTLPPLDAPRNFYIPSDVTLKNICINAGFEIIDIVFPYISSPYSKPVRDHLKFLYSLVIFKYTEFPFWRSMMNLVVKK
jgi:SAM-dependent methyltransferase